MRSSMVGILLFGHPKVGADTGLAPSLKTLWHLPEYILFWYRKPPKVVVRMSLFAITIEIFIVVPPNALQKLCHNQTSVKSHAWGVGSTLVLLMNSRDAAVLAIGFQWGETRDYPMRIGLRFGDGTAGEFPNALMPWRSLLAYSSLR